MLETFLQILMSVGLVFAVLTLGRLVLDFFIYVLKSQVRWLSFKALVVAEQENHEAELKQKRKEEEHQKAEAARKEAISKGLRTGMTFDEVPVQKTHQRKPKGKPKTERVLDLL